MQKKADCGKARQKAGLNENHRSSFDTEPLPLHPSVEMLIILASSQDISKISIPWHTLYCMTLEPTRKEKVYMNILLIPLWDRMAVMSMEVCHKPHLALSSSGWTALNVIL